MLSEQIIAAFKPLPRVPALGIKKIFIVVLGTVVASGAWGQEISGPPKAPGVKDAPAPSVPLAAPAAGLPAALAAARERAELLHEVYASTLVVMHHHYFHSDVAAVPARAMEDIFENMTGLTGGDKARWISVNTKAMSIDHRPSNAFEKKAASELSAGKQAYELVENGVYQRAAVIPLGMNCIGCHTARFTTAPKSPRAGLVISIPLKAEGK